MKRPLVLLCAAAATLFAASAAEAARVSWSVGIDVAPVATYVSSGPAWYPAPARYVAPRVFYAPAPVYAPPVAYGEPYGDYSYDVPSVGVYAAPAPVYVRRPQLWLPPLPPLPRLPHFPRAPWDHDRHHEVGYRR